MTGTVQDRARPRQPTSKTGEAPLRDGPPPQASPTVPLAVTPWRAPSGVDVTAAGARGGSQGQGRLGPGTVPRSGPNNGLLAPR